MKKIRLSKLTFILAGLLIAVLLGSGMFFIPLLLPEKVANKQPEILGESLFVSPSISPSFQPSPSVKTLAKASLKPSAKPTPSANPTISATPSLSVSASPTVLGTTSSSPSPSASLTSNPSMPAGGSPSSSPTSTASPLSSPSPSPAASPNQSIVNVEVQGSKFSVEISGDLNVCQVMQKARDQGKISSLTLDDSYMSSMHSLYIKEMNGMSNNWTFKVNGNAPLGCSLYQVKPNDQIVWKFG